MERGYFYLQPEYVGKFKCDGKKCSLNCCERGWQIVIDNLTYEKYLQMESSAKEITSQIDWNDEEKVYVIKLDEAGRCPFFSEDKLCKIQLKCGEKFLSETCAGYPRQLYNFGEFIERTLTLTCPIAAELVLQNRKMEFEQLPVKLPEWAQGKITVAENPVPSEFTKYILEIQFTAVSILQERRLTIDERLVVLGYYFYQVELMHDKKNLELIPTLNKLYTSEEFFQEQVPMLTKSVNFQVLEFADIIFFGVLGKIYGEDKTLKTEENQKYIDKLTDAMSIDFGKLNEFTAYELAENFYNLEEIRKIFVKDYSNMFENYLVNEVFGGVYPWKIKGSIQQNYAVLLVSFKILELIGLSMTALNRKNDIDFRKDIIKMISDFSVDLNHNADYLKAISDAVKDKADITILMRGLLITSDP